MRDMHGTVANLESFDGAFLAQSCQPLPGSEGKRQRHRRTGERDGGEMEAMDEG